jgi:hypothetical protein
VANNIFKLPSRLPPNYVRTTLRRLAPPADEILRLTHDQQRLLNDELAKLIVLIENDPVRFLKPNPGGQWDFMTCDNEDLNGLFFFAGNKTGKTTAACVIGAEFAIGRQLWINDRPPFDQVRWDRFHRKPPLRIAHFTEDFSSHEETIIPTYLSWIPLHELAPNNALVKSPSGNYTQLRFKSGSVIFLRTYDQGYDKAEGKDYDLIIDDEPPPRDVFTAQLRGIVATDGRIYIAATLLKEAWLYDECQQPHNRIFSAEIYENKWLSAKAIENFSLSLTEEERQIRIFGKPTSLTGAVYPEFADKSPHIIDHVDKFWTENEKPWPIVMGVDPHERKPLYCMWAYLTPHKGLIWFDYALVTSGSKEAIFNELSTIEKGHHSRSRLVIMDPNRGRAKQLGNVSWQETFEENDYEVLLGDDNLALGHSAVHDLLRYRTDSDTGLVIAMPKMQFMENLRGRGGPIAQLLRYSWDDWARGRRIEKAPKEKPKELNKDFPDVVRYVALALDQGLISYDNLISGGYETFVVSGKRNDKVLYG